MDCGYGVLVKGVEEKMVCPKKRTVFGGNMNEEEIVELAVCGLHHERLCAGTSAYRTGSSL